VHDPDGVPESAVLTVPPVAYAGAVRDMLAEQGLNPLSEPGRSRLEQRGVFVIDVHVEAARQRLGSPAFDSDSDDDEGDERPS
jgi:hypothetical protein